MKLLLLQQQQQQQQQLLLLLLLLLSEYPADDAGPDRQPCLETINSCATVIQYS